MKTFYSLLIGFGLLVCALANEQVLMDSHPFVGQSPETTYVKGEDGSHYFKMKEVKGHYNKGLNIVRDSEPIEKTWLQHAKEKIFGKDEETIAWENFYDEMVLKTSKQKNRHYLRGEDDEYELNTNEFETFYGMTLFAGTPSQQIDDVVFDTGSAWLIVKSAGCENCTGTLLDTTASSSVVDGPTGEMNITYGSAFVSGKDIIDHVYLDEAQTFGVDNFQFMLVEYEQGLGDLGGIMGMSRSFEHISGHEAGPLYYHYLQDDGDITDRIFSIYIADHPFQSYYQIGGYSDDRYTGEITWFPVEDTYFWETSVSGVRIKGKKEFLFEQEFKVIVDSGSTIGYIDTRVAKPIIKKLLNWTGFHFKLLGTYFINCKVKKYDPIDFLLDGHWVSIPPEIFVRDLGGRFCTLALQEMDMNGYWLLGGTLLRNYYSIWDDENSRLGLALRTNAYTVEPIQEVDEADMPKKTMKNK